MTEEENPDSKKVWSLRLKPDVIRGLSRIQRARKKVEAYCENLARAPENSA